MPEILTLFKIFLGIASCGIGWWLNDLRAKQVRATLRMDSALEKINKDSDRITRLESETITEAESQRLMSEMERRIMSNFQDFRLEFKDDLSKFRSDLREDLKDIKQNLKSE